MANSFPFMEDKGWFWGLSSHLKILLSIAITAQYSKSTHEQKAWPKKIMKRYLEQGILGQEISWTWSVNCEHDQLFMLYSREHEIRNVRVIFFSKKKDIDVINDNDDAIAKLIAEMRIAAKVFTSNQILSLMQTQ